MSVNVETPPATPPDHTRLAVIPRSLTRGHRHTSLERRDLLPAPHWVDKGDTDAGVLIDRPREDGVTVIAPVADAPSWQARADRGFDQSRVVVDGDRQVVTGPAGKHSL